MNVFFFEREKNASVTTPYKNVTTQHKFKKKLRNLGYAARAQNRISTLDFRHTL